MFTKKQYGLLLLSAIGVFFIIALFIYMSYVGFAQQGEKVEEPRVANKTIEIPDQVVMAQDIPKVKAGTNVVFEIVDQFGFITQTDQYEGINWLGYTKLKLAEIFPDYVITRYSEDEVTLTRVIERQVEPNYVLTIYNGNIVISTERNGYKTFYKETGLEQHDLSTILEKALDKGIPITLEQKDAIINDSDKIYMILQEYDE